MKTENQLFCGVGTALITPFRKGRVDYTALKMLTRRQIEGGVAALVVIGTTGEAPTLTAREKIEAIAAVAEENGGRLPLIAGTGSNDTAASVALTKEAVAAGADGILAVSPYYNRPTSDGLILHYQRIAEAAGKPLIVYNVPSRTGCDIPLSVYEGLREEPLVFGIKEASGSVARSEELLSRFGDRYAVYSGNDDLILPILSIGGSGVISVLSNLLPYECTALCRLFWEGKNEEARALALDLYPLCRALFAESNPIPIKSAVSMVSDVSAEVRLPLTEATSVTKANLAACLTALGVLPQKKA